jgi:hypothetical protein
MHQTLNILFYILWVYAFLTQKFVLQSIILPKIPINHDKLIHDLQKHFKNRT